MIDSDREAFVVQLTGLQSVFRADKTLNRELIEIYWQVFNGWDIKFFAAACNNLLRTKTIPTFPLPGEIIAASGGAERGLMAWQNARDMVAVHGPYMHVIFEDWVTAKSIESMGGWVLFCDCPDADRPFRQREFERLYLIYIDQPAPAAPLQLTGLHDVIEGNIVRIPALQKRKEIE